MNSGVRQAAPAEFTSVVALLAAAFADDPLVAAVAGAARDPAAARSAIFGAAVASARRAGAVLVEEHDGRLVGAALVLDPSAGPLRAAITRTVDGLRFLAAAARIGPELRLLNAADVAGRRLSPRTRHHFLVAVGVVASQRGAGVGRRLVEAAVARARTSHGLRLETENPANAERYARWGFELRGTLPVGPVTVFGMFRPTGDGGKERP